MLKKIGLVILAFPMAVMAVGDVKPVIKSPKAADAVSFDEATSAKTSISQQMVLFEMPPEYECPLFSNSPYTEILTSLDKMQENFNSMFPQCDNKVQNEKVVQKAVELRNAVFDAKKLQDSGQTFKLELTAENLLNAAQKIQESLAIAAQAQTKACYRSPQQFRSVIFAINETFQGIAPVVLDMIAKNPALGKKLGPAVKILAGADSLSKGLVFVEQIAQDSVMFDMTNANNRVNTLKNVCQYMKLYRRLEYMRLQKLGQIQSVYSGFQSKIRDLNQNISEYRKKNNMTPISVVDQNGLVQTLPTPTQDMSDPNYELYSSLKTLLPDELKRLQKAQYDLELSASDLKRPEVAQCQIIQSAKESVTYAKTIEKLSQFAASDWGQTSAYESFEASETLNRQLNAYNEYFNEAKVKKDLISCVKLGQDWIKISLELLSEGQKMVHIFAQELDELRNETDQIKEKKLSKKEREKLNVQTNLASLKSMMQYAAFESSEIEKRAKDMQKYFFDGPDQVQSACTTGEKKDCSWSEKAIGGAKAYYQEYRNNGPVYELLYNNELHFTEAYKQMMRAMGVLIQYEFRIADEEFKGKEIKGKTLKLYLDTQWNYATSLQHLDLRNLQKGSPQHRVLCMNARQMLDKYLVASTHMMSSESLCNMVYPALKEKKVATKLRNYCIPVVSNNGKVEKPSSLQSLIYKMVGNGKRSSDFRYSPKAMVDKLIEKYDNLECEQKSGF